MRVTLSVGFSTPFLLFASLLGTLPSPDLGAQPYGLDSARPVGPFLDGQLPVRRSGSPTDGEWRLVNAFPGLTFVDPIFLTFEPTTQRLLVIEHGGKIWLFDEDPAIREEDRILFLDISERTKENTSGGVKSLAFHPQYGRSGSPNRDYVYLSYRAVIPPGVREQWQFEAYNRISRFTVSGGVMDPDSEVVLIQQFDQHNWHDAGAMFFGNDGFLYISFGDIGGAHDPFNSGQLIDSGFFGGVLRIDVDRSPMRSHPIRRQPRNHGTPEEGWPDSFSNASSTDGYFIPNDNPWLDPDGSVLEEFYAIGLRSPHRMTIDRASGDIWIGDVGQETLEEVNLLRKGANYQWPYKEGTLDGLHARPEEIIGIETPPVHEYSRAYGNCVIGGYVYHGQQFAAELGGKYIFADNGSQSVFALTEISGQPPLVEHFATGPNGNEMSGISCVGENARGELYFLKLNGFQVPGATILKLEAETAPETAPLLLSQIGAFTNLLTLETRDGLIPYDVNNALWSDGALKRRWVAIPNDGVIDAPEERITFSENGEWDFPIGTVLMKHFMLPIDERDPSALRWLETRFLVRGVDGQFYGLTYRWRPDRSDADLLHTGLDEPLDLTRSDGTVEQFTWHYPNRSECLTCHTYAARHVLGLNTRQLNRSYIYESTGRSDNEIRTLNHLGFFDPAVVEAEIPSFLASSPLADETASVEDRVRSYLDSNCSQCHRPGGVWAHFDARLVTPLDLQNIINGPAENTLGIEGARVVVPQDPARSLLLERLSSLDICCAMPPLSKNRLDSDAIDLVTEWIQGLDPGNTIPPRVTSTSPAAGAGNMDVDTLVSATFNERLASSTVTGSTFVLRDGSGASVAAQVTYDDSSLTAYLDPNSALQPGATYSATLTGGDSGLKDLAGNALASNVSWSFTTASGTSRAFIRADANDDGFVNLSDAIETLQVLFARASEQFCQDALDSNDDGTVNLSDPIFTLNFLFSGGSPVPFPYPGPGMDPTPDELTCVRSPLQEP